MQEDFCLLLSLLCFNIHGWNTVGYMHTYLRVHTVDVSLGNDREGEKYINISPLRLEDHQHNQTGSSVTSPDSLLFSSIHPTYPSFTSLSRVVAPLRISTSRKTDQKKNRIQNAFQNRRRRSSSCLRAWNPGAAVRHCT